MCDCIRNTFIASDGKEMVFIHGGEFYMGNDCYYKEERPVHKVIVSSFYMDKYLVTNREYKVFCDDIGMPYPENPRWEEIPNYFINYPDYPVVNVSWEEARRYAKWVGKRLPTEEEWEYAACGGLRQPLYPWGNERPEGDFANFAERNTDYAWSDFRYSCGYKYTSPVGVYKPNGYGLYDMAGNIWEWCEDWFFEYCDTVRDTAPFQDGWGGSKICRGGCYHSDVRDLRVARRRQILGGQGLISVGFRCVRDIEIVHERDEIYEQINEDSEWKNKLKSTSVKMKDNIELCLGVNKLSEPQARYIKNLGFTSVEQYVTWETIENKGKDQWDFSIWDEQVAIMEKVGLKWVPFLIAGPAYSLPHWYRECSDFEGLKCLEHNIESKIQSIWDKKFYFYIERYISKFAEHYKHYNILETVLLGITGDFGEAIFPDWHGNWTTQIPGLYHSHAGYWCNDRFAKKNFKEEMEQKYLTIESLNEAWNTYYPSFEAITFPEIVVDSVEGFRVDEHTPAGQYKMNSYEDQIRWLDFIDWYRNSMTEYADVWMKIAKKYFGNIPAYLCTGGNAISYHGSDFAQQCKIASKYDGGVRITNEASKYATNFFVTNWVSSAGNFYNIYFGFEPAGKVTEKGVVCRIYNATVAGAKELHYYESNIFDTKEKVDTFIKNIGYLHKNKPIREIGVLYPDVSIILRNVSMVEVGKNFELLRDYTDFAYIDDLTIRDCILNQIKYLIICGGEIYRKDTINSIHDWVNEGGILIGYNIQSINTVDGSNYSNILFDMQAGIKHIGKGETYFIPYAITLQKGASFIPPIVGSANATIEKDIKEYENNIFDPITRYLANHNHTIIDGKIDGIYTARLSDRIMLLNTRDKDYDKQIILPNGTKKTVSLDFNSIAEIKY